MGNPIFLGRYAFPILYAVNVGPWCCLRAGGNECELIGSKRGFAAPRICTDCGLKIALVCEPESSCLQAVTPRGTKTSSGSPQNQTLSPPTQHGLKGRSDERILHSGKLTLHPRNERIAVVLHKIFCEFQKACEYTVCWGLYDSSMPNTISLPYEIVKAS